MILLIFFALKAPGLYQVILFPFLSVVQANITPFVTKKESMDLVPPGVASNDLQ